MVERTDVHRPSEIIPDDYAFVLAFSGATREDGIPMPPVNLDAAIEVYREHGVKVHEGIFQCDCCGARYIYGDIWMHRPTGKVISIGWICSEKYDLLADRENYRRQKASEWERARREALAAQAAEAVAKTLEKHPGLKEALEADHYITRDIKSRFEHSGRITPPQIELVFKLASRVAEYQARRAAEASEMAAIPEALLNGRVRVSGRVLKAMWRDTDFGEAAKMIVAVPVGDDGRYCKIWSTVPNSILTTGNIMAELSWLEGAEISFVAQISRSDDDETFGFAKRPAQAQVVLAPECGACDGTGEVEYESTNGPAGISQVAPCGKCGGSGKAQRKETS